MSLLNAWARGLTLGTLDSVTAGYLETAEWADKPEGSNARFSRAEQSTARHGFTHIRIAGDWSGRTKPRGGSLKGATE